MSPDTASPGVVALPEIAVLPDHVVDQIAAGEVVERPASVVKELVENALDAGATHVTVEVEAGGKRLIRVLDNGHGMTAEQARLALQRHATSKLRAVGDLFGIATMGFRGEALPSIAAVSRMSITTRTHGQMAGVQIDVEAGAVAGEREAGVPVGTRVEIRDLLFNVPARQKFLKGDATEASHVTDAVQKLALAHPHVHFRLRHGARTAIDAPLHPDGFERARALLGTRLGRRLHRVAGREGGVEVVAFLAAPELAQTTTRGLQLFVGKRPIKDRGLVHAVNMGYGELVPRGRYPVAVVFVDAPGDAVDINVHPQKLEVRFSDAQAVYAAVRHTVRRGVAEAPWLADGAGASPVRMHAIASSEPPPPRASRMAHRYAETATRMLFPMGRGRPAHAREPAAPRLARTSFPVAAPRPLEHDGAGSPPQPLRSRPAASLPAPAPSSSPSPSPSPSRVVAEGSGPRPGIAGDFFTRLRYVGQVDRTYLVCEAEGEMVLIDQHAAHERVEFQRLRERYAERAIPVQRALIPHEVELDEALAAVAEEQAEVLTALGFELRELEGKGDGARWAIQSVPAGVKGDPPAVVRELLGELAERGGSRAVDERLDLVLATIACHSVVRAGDLLSRDEAVALLESMDTVDFKAHCPHGRPVLLRISIEEIARRFGR